MKGFLTAVFLFCAWFGIQSASISDETLVNRLDDLENRQKICEHEIKELQKKLQNNTVHKRAVDGVNIAFSTLLSHDQGHIGISQTIKFDQVLLNEGSGYSVNTGTFTVPVAGVYLFSYFFAHGYDAGQTWLRLMKNGNKVNGGVVDSFHRYQDLQGGNIAIIRVETGDEIWLEAFHQNNAFLYGAQGFTSFSGVLLGMI